MVPLHNTCVALHDLKPPPVSTATGFWKLVPWAWSISLCGGSEKRSSEGLVPRALWQERCTGFSTLFVHIVEL